MKKLLSIQELSQSKWPKAIAQAFGENLVSAFLFGDCLEENFNALAQPWTAGIILKDSSPDLVKKISALVPVAARENLVFSHFWSSTEILSTLEDFPLEYLEISSRHAILCGIVPLEGFIPKKESLIRQCLREWKAFLFHKRAVLAKGISGKSDAQAAMVALQELTPLLNGIFYVSFGKYPESRRQVLETFPEIQMSASANEGHALETLLDGVQALVARILQAS